MSVPQFNNAGADENSKLTNHVATKAGMQAALDNPNGPTSNTVLKA
jgi:hypothetical protein